MEKPIPLREDADGDHIATIEVALHYYEFNLSLPPEKLARRIEHALFQAYRHGQQNGVERTQRTIKHALGLV